MFNKNWVWFSRSVWFQHLSCFSAVSKSFFLFKNLDLVSLNDLMSFRHDKQMLKPNGAKINHDSTLKKNYSTFSIIYKLQFINRQSEKAKENTALTHRNQEFSVSLFAEKTLRSVASMNHEKKIVNIFFSSFASSRTRPRYRFVCPLARAPRKPKKKPFRNLSCARNNIYSKWSNSSYCTRWSLSCLLSFSAKISAIVFFFLSFSAQNYFLMCDDVNKWEKLIFFFCVLKLLASFVCLEKCFSILKLHNFRSGLELFYI